VTKHGEYVVHHHADTETTVAYHSRSSKAVPTRFEDLLAQLELEEIEQIEEQGSLEPMFPSSLQQLMPNTKVDQTEKNEIIQDNDVYLGDLYAVLKLY